MHTPTRVQTQQISRHACEKDLEMNTQVSSAPPCIFKREVDTLTATTFGLPCCGNEDDPTGMAARRRLIQQGTTAILAKQGTQIYSSLTRKMIV